MYRKDTNSENYYDPCNGRIQTNENGKSSKHVNHSSKKIFKQISNRPFPSCPLPLASVSKRVLVQKFSYENEFGLDENKCAVT